MTSTPIASFASAQRRWPLITRGGWLWVGLLSALFIGLHRTYLERLFRIVTKSEGDNALQLLLSAVTSRWDPDWSHALVVPFISLFFIYQAHNRQRLANASARVCWWGLPLVFAGLFSYTWWIYPGRNDMFQGYSMIVSLFGLTLFVLGPQVTKVLAFPVLYLVFAVKISDKLWEAIAWKLQQVAAQSATVALKSFGAVMGFDATNRGSTIDLRFMRGGTWITESLNVAEACSGLRMLMAFVALGVAWAFLRERSHWQRAAIVLMTVPIAVAVNVGRVTAVGLLYLYNPQMAQGDFHVFVGLLMLIPAAGLFWLLGWIMDHIVIREEEKRPLAMPAVQTDPQQAPPPAVSGWKILRATGLGVVLTVLLGSAYGGLLAFFQPDLIFEGLSHLTVIVLMAVTLAAMAALCLSLPRLLRHPAGPAARRALALSFVAGILLTAMLGQNGVIAATKTVLIKKAVPLRHPLYMIPNQLGTWTKIYEDPPMTREMLEALGTDQYVSRIYEDSTVAENAPGRAVRIHVAYYTGTPDTVPHVADRCFTAAGLDGLDSGSVTLALSGADYRPDPLHDGVVHPSRLERFDQRMVRVPSKQILAKTFTFVDPKNPGRIENVVYFFAANGKFLHSPEAVRLQGFDPRDEYSYYCKVEVQALGVPDAQQAAERSASLLSAAVPEIMACLPDWIDVTEGRWPADESPTH
jgi:exosortase